MKAKEYFKQLCDDSSPLLFAARINNIHSSMVNEIKNLIAVRHIQRDESRLSVLKEMDNKWKAIVRLVHKSSYDIDIDDDEFILYMYDNVPEFKKFIHVEKCIDENTDDGKENIPYVHKLVPLNEITDDNIKYEILECMYAIGKYSDMDIPLNSLTPLIHRVTLLRYWKKNGINYEQIDEFEKDRDEFVNNVIRPMM
jgi:hypothetical protein